MSGRLCKKLQSATVIIAIAIIIIVIGSVARFYVGSEGQSVDGSVQKHVRIRRLFQPDTAILPAGWDDVRPDTSKKPSGYEDFSVQISSRIQQINTDGHGDFPVYARP